MTDSTPESAEAERPASSQVIPGVNTLTMPVGHRFDPPLEYRTYEEIYEEVKVAMAAIDKRRFGRKKAK